MKHLSVLFLFFTLLLAPVARAEEFRLAWPVDCTAGETCWIQQYADHDKGPGVVDYTCGSQSYDGHDGTDIRIRDTSSSAAVLAAAAGTITATRDGMADSLLRNEADRAAVNNRECGNGVVVDHGGGFETQYCHMRQGSIAVTTGDSVTAGTRLGDVGYSGEAAFPHLHLTLRKDGAVVDPFSSTTRENCAAADVSLWTKDAAIEARYQGSTVLRMGWNSGAVELPALETGTLQEPTPNADWPGLVAYVWAINLKADDAIALRVSGPEGFEARNETTLDRAKAQYVLFAGKSLKAPRWPAGEYTATFSVVRGGTVALEKSVVMRLE